MPKDIVSFCPMYSTKSSIEVLFERRTKKAAILWDIDCLERLDGLLALVLSDNADGDDRTQKLFLVAYAHLAAGPFLHSQPATAMQIMTLACLYDPDDLSILVDNETQLDVFRRLIRVYLLYHEIGHVIYRLNRDAFPEQEIAMRDALDAFKVSMDFKGTVERLPETEYLIEQGFMTSYRDLAPGTHEQMVQMLETPLTKEETWCDVFACEHLLNWARDRNIGPEYCFATDRLLHLMVGGRLQWQTFWSQDYLANDWEHHPILTHYQTRADIRDMIFRKHTFFHYRQGKVPNDADEAELLNLLKNFQKIQDSLAVPLMKRFFDRSTMALGCLGQFDRKKVLSTAQREWGKLSAKKQKAVIDDIRYDLTWA